MKYHLQIGSRAKNAMVVHGDRRPVLEIINEAVNKFVSEYIGAFSDEQLHEYVQKVVLGSVNYHHKVHAITIAAILSKLESKKKVRRLSAHFYKKWS